MAGAVAYGSDSYDPQIVDSDLFLKAYNLLTSPALSQTIVLGLDVI